MKLIYNLVQQTPMIHFQAKNGECEVGLTLRPSEVKPKLDRFIRQWYKKNNDNKPVPVEWLTEYDPKNHNGVERPDHEALNYKMRITAENVEGKTISKDSPYFGNMGGNDKYCILHSNPLRMEIQGFIPDLMKCLEEGMETFFLITNFGTRQDKGFGCFVVQNENNPNRVDELLKTWYDNRPIIKLDYTNCNNQNIDYTNCNNQNIDYLAEINWIYKLLKSGVNMKGDYVKSALTEYFLKDGIAGEKRALKRSGVGPAVYDKTDKNGKYYAESEMERQKDITNEQYIRGLFGYGERQNWFYADEDHKKANEIYLDENTNEWEELKRKKNGKLVAVDKKVHIKIKIDIDKDMIGKDVIDRIPSPIQFVVANNSIYILPIIVDERIYEPIFVFSSQIDKYTKRKGDKEPKLRREDEYSPGYTKKEELKLKIPQDFNLDSFIEWFGHWLAKDEKDKIKRRELKENKPLFENIGCVNIEVIKGANN